MNFECFHVKVKNEKIFGILFFSKNYKNKIPIILTHGLADNLNQYPLPQITKELVNLGFPIFRFDFRGCGNSEGKEENFSISSQIEDLNRIIKFAKEKTKWDKVGIISKSISCVASFIVASKRNDIAFIIALGAPLNIEKPWTRDEIAIAKEKGYIFFKGFKYGYKLAEESIKLKEVYKNSLKKINIPVLLIRGEKDEIVTPEEAKELYSLIPIRNKKLIEIKNADHSFKTEESNIRDLISSINSFLNELKLENAAK